MAAVPATGPRHIRYFEPVLRALQELGGSGNPNKVKAAVAAALGLENENLSEDVDSGAARFSSDIGWARYYLAQVGYIDSSEHGVWNLTELGLSTKSISSDEAQTILKQVKLQRQIDRLRKELDELGVKAHRAGILPLDFVGYRGELLETIRNLSAAGFERLCQRLLCEAGFQDVRLTGGTGDQGIDGYGVLEVSPLVSFRVLFQCKRYRGSVSAPEVRDFLTAVMGRADKGIYLTTGTFTSSAREEANRIGVPPIELVDGEKLIEMFEELRFGLIPRKAFVIDHEFFAQFDDETAPEN